MSTLVTSTVFVGLTIIPGLLAPKPDFQISLTNDPMLVKASEANDTEVRVQSVRNFTGIVSLRVESPQGLTWLWVTEGQDKVLLGTTGSSRFEIRGQAVGNYTVNIVASSGSLYHSVGLAVRVQNLTISSGVRSFTLARGTSGSADITLTSVNGLTGLLALSGTAYSPDVYGDYRFVDPTITISLTPSSVALNPGQTTRVTLSVTIGQNSTPGERLVGLGAIKGCCWRFGIFIPLTVV